MKQYLCLKPSKVYEVGKLYKHDNHGVGLGGPVSESGAIIISWKSKFKEVETFIKDDVTWIRHDGGDCPVPGGWKVEFSHEFGGHVFGRGGLLARLFCWGPIVAYRIISTGEPEESGAGGGIELGDKDESEINDTKENLSLMDTLTQNQRDYITRKELEQAEKQQAQEQEKADEIEHKQQQSNDLVRANGVFNDR